MYLDIYHDVEKNARVFIERLIARPVAAQSKTRTINSVLVTFHIHHLLTCSSSTSRRRHASNTRVRVFTRVLLLRPETAKLAVRPRGRIDTTMHLHRPHSASAAYAAGVHGVS